MSNQLTLQYTKFVDLDVAGEEDSAPSYGFRAFDMYASVYYNLCFDFQELVELVNEENVIEYLTDNYTDEFGNEFDGVLINGVWVERESK